MSELEKLKHRIAELEAVNADRLRTEEALILERARLRALYEISSDQALSLDQQIVKTLKTGLRMLNLETGIVSHIEGDTYTILHFISKDVSMRKGQNFELGNTYCSLAIEVGDVLSVDRMGESEYSGHPCYKAFRLEAYIGVPIMIDGALFGTLNFSSSQPRENPFTDSDRDFVRLMSRWAGTVLGRQRSDNELNVYREHLETLVDLRTTALNKANKALQEAQKMRAIGRLAGGIAHDFNNILGAIFGYTELLQLQLEEDPVRASYIDGILTAGVQARGLVRQILTFSRQSKVEKEPVDIGIIIRETLELLKPSTPVNVEVRKRIERELGYIMASPAQIHQVVMNICANAYEAMEKTGGMMEVIAEQDSLYEATAYHGMAQGEYIKLSVTDTGTGMDDETLQHLFEPYFTTKGLGEGRGMGMALVHGIVQDHGGTVNVHSELETGTSILVFLPVCKEVPKEKPKFVPDVFKGAGERVLFIDDEEALLDVGKKLLPVLGYRGTCLPNPIKALELFRESPHSFDVVVTDMTMPKMTGLQLTAEILKIRPGIPVILCAGFSHTLDHEEAKQAGVRELLEKPIAMRELANAIHRALSDKDI